MISPLRAIFRRFARPAAGIGRRRPSPRAALTRRDRWESLGLGMLGSEALEQRVLMAADLAVSLDNAHIWYAPATQTVTTIVVENIGDAGATGPTAPAAPRARSRSRPAARPPSPSSAASAPRRPATSSPPPP
jgi:hypothetical protein